MLGKEFFFGLKGRLKRLIQISSTDNDTEKDSSRCENLTSLPGIGINNCRVFYDAGYTTPESIISADDADLMKLSGVGIGFIKKLRTKVGRL
ncbi:helix-hairpin-helix domain-containing protein [Prochlorococcus sp. MIT 1223]|uniref:helix-hairpin-helix domain-containing protein n=1 Tax=Prochlorococcus sp. MIT 1223 TaxID=3096217 RepID=UPI002A75D7A5|nr:helix-hairpin-helix domain-containing protein [Prochlorococcus sp. MIT 1223]